MTVSNDECRELVSLAFAKARQELIDRIHEAIWHTLNTGDPQPLQNQLAALYTTLTNLERFGQRALALDFAAVGAIPLPRFINGSSSAANEAWAHYFNERIRLVSSVTSEESRK